MPRTPMTILDGPTEMTLRDERGAFQVSADLLLGDAGLLIRAKNYLARTILLEKPLLEINKMQVPTIWKCLSAKAYAMTVARGAEIGICDIMWTLSFQQQLTIVQIQDAVGSHLSSNLRRMYSRYLDMVANRNKEATELWKEVLGSTIISFDAPSMQQPLPALPTPMQPATQPAMPDDVNARLAQILSEVQSGLAKVAQNLKTGQDKLEARQDNFFRNSQRDIEQFRIELETMKRPIIIQMPDPSEQVIVDTTSQHNLFGQVILLLSQKVNVFLKGPSGCGKTHMAKAAAKALNLNFHFTGAVSSEFKLLGYNNAMGNYVPTDFFRAYTQGGLFLWDEVDASRSEALLAFNAALANDMMDFPHGSFERHPDFRCIAAANTFGTGADRTYVGREQLDGATLDRFFVLEMDYDESLERSLAHNVQWLAFVQGVRRRVSQLNLRHIISTRAILTGQNLLAAGMDANDVMRGVLWKGLPDSDVERIISHVHLDL